MMSRRFYFKCSMVSFVALIMFVLVPVAQAAVIQIINMNAPGVGFNDTTPFTPVGGNNATTLGQARLNAFQFGADLIGAQLSSNVVIKVQAKMIPMGGGPASAILGSAGPTSVFRDFPGALRPATWYVQALANKLSGVDQDPLNNDINAQFNSDVDGPIVLGPRVWYYGLDGNPPAGDIEFVTVILHEIIHGLGFLSLVDLATGGKFMAADDAYMQYLEHHGAIQPAYPLMTNGQRIAASTSINMLHWTGAKVVAANGGHAVMFAPNPQQPGSSVSHFDEATTPLELMSPFANGVQHNIGMAAQLLSDLGWGVVAAKSHARNDFNGDGKSDLLFRETAPAGRTLQKLMNGRALLSQSFVSSMPVSWPVVGTGDFNGDGKVDTLYRQTSTGRMLMKLMNGRTLIGQRFVSSMPASWAFAGTGDFNGDGKADMLFREITTGRMLMKLMNGFTLVRQNFVSSMPASWAFAGTGDFNGDGRSDMLFREITTGRMLMKLMNGFTMTGHRFVSSLPATWAFAGIGDFNGDGKSDTLFRQIATGNLLMKQMNGFTLISHRFVPSLPAAWPFSGTGDFNGDGKSDILFRHPTNGRVLMKLMNGFTQTRQGFVSSMPASWSVVNTK